MLLYTKLMRAVGNLVGFMMVGRYIMHLKCKQMIRAVFPKSILPTVFSTIFLAHDCTWETQAYCFQPQIVACMGSVSPPNGQYTISIYSYLQILMYKF